MLLAHQEKWRSYGCPTRGSGHLGHGDLEQTMGSARGGHFQKAHERFGEWGMFHKRMIGELMRGGVEGHATSLA